MKKLLVLFSAVGAIANPLIAKSETCEQPVSRRDKVQACLSDLIAHLLSKTDFSDLSRIEITRSPLIGRRYSFKAADSTGNVFTGSIRARITNDITADPRTGIVTGRETRRNLINEATITGPAFALKNQRGGIAYQVRGESTGGC